VDKNSKKNIDRKGIESKFLEQLADYWMPVTSSSSLASHDKRPKFNYQIALEEASRSMIRFKKPEHLIRMIIRMLDKEVGVTHTAVLLYKEQKDSFVLIDSKGEEGKKIPAGYIRLTPDSALVSAFTEKNLSSAFAQNNALVYDFVNRLLDDKKFIGHDNHLKKRLKDIRTQMDLLQAEICIPSYFKKQLLGILVMGGKLSGEKFKRDEISFFMTLANDVAMAISNAQLIESLQGKLREIALLYEKSHRLFIHTSIALATAIEARDPYTHGHTERVTSYSLAIAAEMEDFPEVKAFVNFSENLRIAALLHDIGKIGIPDNILNKKRKLTLKEIEKIKEHPAIGASILYPIKELGNIIDGVKYHQEKYDGTGYPAGLKGKKIPLLARIISVADAFDAVTTDRPYRHKKSAEKTILELKQFAGTQFDPDIFTAFLKAYEKNKLQPTI